MPHKTITTTEQAFETFAELMPEKFTYDVMDDFYLTGDDNERELLCTDGGLTQDAVDAILAACEPAMWWFVRPIGSNRAWSWELCENLHDHGFRVLDFGERFSKSACAHAVLIAAAQWLHNMKHGK